MKWMRPSGTEIETNNEKATIQHCVDQGWKPMEDLPETEIPVGAQALGVEDPNIAKPEPIPEGVFASPDGSYSTEYDGQMHNYPDLPSAVVAVGKEAERIEKAAADEAEAKQAAIDSQVQLD